MIYCTTLERPAKGLKCVDCGREDYLVLGCYHDENDVGLCSDKDREPICMDCADERRDRLND